MLYSKPRHPEQNGVTNATLVDRFFEEVFNRRDVDAAREILAPDFVAHHPSVPGGVIRGVDGILAMLDTFRAGFPDLHYTVKDHISEGDRIAVRWIAVGTHRGTFFGVPATGKQVEVSGIDVFRVAHGQLVESWVSSDFFGLFVQLGAFPTGRGGPAPE